jgi:hypothetical protein
MATWLRWCWWIRVQRACATWLSRVPIAEATVEQWPDQVAAQRRADYIQQMLAAQPMLGTEWTVVKGPLLLRVTGKLKPSDEKAYEASFNG